MQDDGPGADQQAEPALGRRVRIAPTEEQALDVRPARVEDIVHIIGAGNEVPKSASVRIVFIRFLVVADFWCRVRLGKWCFAPCPKQTGRATGGGSDTKDAMVALIP
jgi:hypothetical protein